MRLDPGSATLAGTPQITVDAHYAGDDNGNNRILIEWGYEGVDFSLGSHLSPVHPASPYNYVISPLDNTQVYQVRVTFQDADNGSDPVETYNNQRSYNPLLHNAVSTGSGTSKWASGWGIADAGAQYGEFACNTCHVRSSGNIKRIRRDWTDAGLPDVPAKLNAEIVDFQSTNQFGLDDSTDHTSSNRICEACHTRTDHHRYDESTTPGNPDHYGSTQCIDCHEHNQGFTKPTCSTCHGGGMIGVTENNFWPDGVDESIDIALSENNSGEHVVHMTRLADKVYGYTLQQLLDSANSKNEQIALCSRCHPNPGSDINHGLGDDVGDVNTVQRVDGTADLGTVGSYTTANGTCSNVDCHNGKATTVANAWYAGNSPDCMLCHSLDGSNGEALFEPNSGLHYSTSPNGAELHDNDFSAGGGRCTSCHTSTPSTGHFNGIGESPSVTTFNFQSSAGIDIKLNTVGDATDDTCAANCHSDNGYWYRSWSADAFDATAFDITQPLPPRCGVCHGEFDNGWSEGTSHYNQFVTYGYSGAIHNSQNPAIKPGAACEDCHVYPTRSDLHENGLITLHDDLTAPDEQTPKENDAATGVYCAPCHEMTAVPPAGSPDNTFTYSQAFPAWTGIEIIEGTRNPEYTCFSGANGCHGDTNQNWWPNVESTDPSAFPNRAGAHYAHGTTIGELLAAQRGRPDVNPVDGKPDVWQEDRNDTCNFCHPMDWNTERLVWESKYHRQPTPETGTTIVDVFGGHVFPTSDVRGNVSGGDPANDAWTDADTDPITGFAYQLEPDPSNPGQGIYPLDMDAEYWQFLNAFKSDSTVRTGVCSQVACHSNSPYTPNWYGDEQAPGLVTGLTGYTHDIRGIHVPGETDTPGTVLLTWNAPGDNGDFDGTAYEYEVYYSDAGAITDANIGSAMRAGAPPTVYGKDEAQEMVVDGLIPQTSYWFAVRTKDQPRYKDADNDNHYETFVADGNLSPVSSVGPLTAHSDDVEPIFYGINSIEPHDEPGVVNLRWDAARDHTLPLTYRVWYSVYSLKTHVANGGDLYDAVTDPNGSDLIECFNAGSPPTAVGDSGGDYCIESETSTANSDHLHGLQTGDIYSFIVRAYDALGNHDHNTIVQMGMPASAPAEPTVTEMYLLNSSQQLIKQADPANPNWQGAGTFTMAMNDVLVLEATSVLARQSIVTGISFDIETENSGRDTILVSGELGYMTGATFNRLGALSDTDVQNSSATMGKRATRLQKFQLANYNGLVPAGVTLAVRLDRWDTSARDLGLNFGTSATKGQLLVNVQPYNNAPPTPSVSTNLRTGGYLDIDWNAVATDGEGQTMHYDVFGSDDNGANYHYVIATGLSSTDDLNGAEFGRVTWDTVGDGINGTANLVVSVEAGDGYQYEVAPPGSGTYETHSIGTSGTVAIDNSQDQEAPAAVTISRIEPRPKQGTVYLEWLAVGNDGYNHGTRAAYYDLRFRKVSDGLLSAGNWNDAATNAAQAEPVPNFAGWQETFELLNMAPDVDYAVAIVTCDAGENAVAGDGDDNCSGLSNVVTLTSGQYYCGICHTTPPSEPNTAGTHRQHGYTLVDCAKCHGDGTSPDGNDVTTYDGRHYDGVINVGWAETAGGTREALNELAIASGGGGVTISQAGNAIYVDPDGAGGYNAGAAYNPGQPLANTDSGKCMNFGPANVSGCHGPFQPKWASDTVEAKVPPQCADCHGDKTMVVNDDAGTGLGRLTDPYLRQWDDVDTSQALISGYYPPSEQVMASPPVDNHGQSAKTDRYTGAHLRHLNSSFRFAKGDSCRLCHRDTFEAGLHANRQVDVVFDDMAGQDETNPAIVDIAPVGDGKGVSCSSLNNLYCHDTGARWAEPGAKCNSCHGMGAKTFDPVGDVTTIGHVMGTMGDVVDCTYCHLAGHPQSPDGINPGDPDALLINNNPAIGINYRSGGIHLKRVYPWGTYTSLAEICWGCHDQNNDGDLNDAGDINEFGQNIQAATGSSPYDYGTLDQKNWIGATWTSAKPQFAYKTGSIQSTHSTDPTGTSVVTWDAANGRYNENLDAVGQLRCSNCHDVHDLNKADGDTMSGAPYLRGTWMGNPYEEDGAPYNRTYSSASIFGPTPRAGTGYDELGGFYIDQNNVVPGTGNSTQTEARYPTSGWTAESSSGLCLLCHSDKIDTLDKNQDEFLWLGTNGHSNAVLGGTGSNRSNIFDYSHGRPTPNEGNCANVDTANIVGDMAATQRSGACEGVKDGNRMYLYRSKRVNYMTPQITSDFAWGAYNWGNSIDAGTSDTLYHQFSCSKCHNPHASRLPKLMITNCLDVRHNTWDDAQGAGGIQDTFTSSTLDPVDRDMPAAYYATAQNCHRFDSSRGDTDNDGSYENKALRGGWNKVTPWVKANDGSDTEHKGTYDPAYGTSNGTNPWRHSDFPTEPSGW